MVFSADISIRRYLGNYYLSQEEPQADAEAVVQTIETALVIDLEDRTSGTREKGDVIIYSEEEHNDSDNKSRQSSPFRGSKENTPEKTTILVRPKKWNCSLEPFARRLVKIVREQHGEEACQCLQRAVTAAVGQRDGEGTEPPTYEELEEVHMDSPNYIACEYQAEEEDDPVDSPRYNPDALEVEEKFIEAKSPISSAYDEQEEVEVAQAVSPNCDPDELEMEEDSILSRKKPPERETSLTDNEKEEETIKKKQR